MELTTGRLQLRLQSPEQVQAMLASLPDEALAEVSPEWLALVHQATAADPWIHGFTVWLMEQATDPVDSASDKSAGHIGFCGFKAPPSETGCVEIAYGIAEQHQCRGYATECVGALTEFAFGHDGVQTVLAHTRPEANASTRVLTKCGFNKTMDVVDPHDGAVWRWQKNR
jgi:RimJ/RimL family protein N-acetyltransferase